MDIKVNGRTLSDRPLVLGVQGDNNVEELRFLIPRYTGSGVDLSQGIGYAVFRLPDGTDGYVSLTPEVMDTDENMVALTLLVGSQMTEQKGSGKLCLKVAGLEAALWSSAICDIFVGGTIELPSPQPYSLFRTMSVGPRISNEDSEPPLTVTERAINIPTELQTIAVAQDENSETVKIMVPRYFDGQDLSVHDFILHTEMGSNGTDDILFNNQNGQMKSVEDSTVTLTWVLRPPQTSFEGKLNIQLLVQGDAFKWHSLIGELTIAKHITGDPVVPATPSMYEQWLAEIKEQADYVRSQAANIQDALDNLDAIKDAIKDASAAAERAEAAAKTSETNAKASETAAKTSASAAKTSETNAANSKTAAAGSASAAENSASAAAGSQKVAEEKAALAAQERVKAEAAAKTAEGWTPDGAVDAIWAARLDGTNTAEIFRQYAAALVAQGIDVDTIVRRWFTLLWDNNTYGTKLYKFATSATPDGELIQASAELGAAKPGTNTTAAVDPYFPRGAFWAIEVAYEIENKEPVVKAVAGVNGVDRETLLSGKFGMVGVAQKTGWVCDTADDNYYYHYYRAAPAYFLADANAYKPLPEGVAVDGSLRPFVIHAKYMAGRGADGKLTSASGLAVVHSISMDSQRAEWKKRGADYCGICGCDLAFRMRMFWAKYGKKGNSGTLEGCSGYNYQYKAAVSETGVTRVIMTAAQADSYLVGSTVSVGDVGTGTSTDRDVASMLAKADNVRILSIEDVTVDGVAYKALNLDTATPFDTEKDKTIVSTMPWHSGGCDNVQGADGSPTSCTSGKEPFIIQLLECQPGGYAISADQLTEQVLDDTAYTHRLVFFRQAAQIATSITANAVRSPIVLTMPTTQTGQWMYEKDVEIDADGNMYPVDAGSGASSTNGYRAAVLVPAAGSRVYAWWAWGTLAGGGACGLSGGAAFILAGTAYWDGLCGACGSGANRGEYAGA